MKKAKSANYKPLNYPKALTVTLRTRENAHGYTDCIFRVTEIGKGRGKGKHKIIGPIKEDNFLKLRKEALTASAEVHGYKKIPATWQKAVSKDFKEFLKENHLNFEIIEVPSYSRKE